MLGVVACGDSRGMNTPIENVPERFAEAYCAQLEQCGGGPLIRLFLQGADCSEQLTRELRSQQLPRWQQAMEAGTLEYDGRALDSCIQQIESLGCDVFTQRAFDACEGAFMGQVEPGGTCNVDIECSGSRICRFPDDTCPGTCGERRGEGSSCSDDEECMSGLLCQQGTCTDPAASGEPCGTSDHPGCALPNTCVGADAEAGEPGTCQPLEELLTEAEGESCNLEGGPYCMDGLSCAVTGVSGGQAQFECVASSESGGSCRVGFPDPCPNGEYCDAEPMNLEFEGTCTALPTDGESCRQGELAARCAPDHTCVDGTCARVGELGAECGDDAECYSDRCEDGRCTEPPFCAAG